MYENIFQPEERSAIVVWESRPIKFNGFEVLNLNPLLHVTCAENAARLIDFRPRNSQPRSRVCERAKLLRKLVHTYGTWKQFFKKSFFFFFPHKPRSKKKLLANGTSKRREGKTGEANQCQNRRVRQRRRRRRRRVARQQPFRWSQQF